MTTSGGRSLHWGGVAWGEDQRQVGWQQSSRVELLPGAQGESAPVAPGMLSCCPSLNGSDRPAGTHMDCGTF